MRSDSLGLRWLSLIPDFVIEKHNDMRDVRSLPLYHIRPGVQRRRLVFVDFSHVLCRECRALHDEKKIQTRNMRLAGYNARKLLRGLSLGWAKHLGMHNDNVNCARPSLFGNYPAIGEPSVTSRVDNLGSSSISVSNRFIGPPALPAMSDGSWDRL